MGGMKCWDGVEEYLVGQPVWLDTAAISSAIGKEQLARMIKNHGADRILFASDCPWSDPRQEKALIEGLGLEKSEENAIFFGNIQALLG